MGKIQFALGGLGQAEACGGQRFDQREPPSLQVEPESEDEAATRVQKRQDESNEDQQKAQGNPNED